MKRFVEPSADIVTDGPEKRLLFFVGMACILEILVDAFNYHGEGNNISDAPTLAMNAKIGGASAFVEVADLEIA